MRNDRGSGPAVDQIIHEAADRDQRLGLRLKAGTGGERRQPAQAPGAPRQFGDRITQRRRIAALKTIGDNDDSGAARVAAESRYREERLQRIADAGAAVPVADQMRRRRQRLLAAFETQRAADAGEPCAEGEDLDVRNSMVNMI